MTVPNNNPTGFVSVLAAVWAENPIEGTACTLVKPNNVASVSTLAEEPYSFLITLVQPLPRFAFEKGLSAHAVDRSGTGLYIDVVATTETTEGNIATFTLTTFHGTTATAPDGGIA